MSEKRKIWFAACALLVIIAGMCGSNPIYDATRLKIFSRRIAGADRVVATWTGSSVRLTFTGDDAGKIVRAVSSAVSGRMPDKEFMCMYEARATFYRGTNDLGQIGMCGSLFLIKRNPPFIDGTGMLESLVYTPTLKALREPYGNDSVK